MVILNSILNIYSKVYLKLNKYILKINFKYIYFNTLLKFILYKNKLFYYIYIKFLNKFSLKLINLKIKFNTYFIYFY